MLLAVWNNQLEVVEALKTVENIDWNVQSLKGWSPVTLALKRNNIDVLKTILSVPGIDLSLKTHQGSTATSIAISQGGTSNF